MLKNSRTKTQARKSHAKLAPDFTDEEMWPLNSPELYPLDHVCGKALYETKITKMIAQPRAMNVLM